MEGLTNNKETEGGDNDENTYDYTQRKSCTYGLGSDPDIYSLECFWFWVVWPTESRLCHGGRRGADRHSKDGKDSHSACRTTMRNEIQCSGSGNHRCKKGQASDGTIYPGKT